MQLRLLVRCVLPTNGISVKDYPRGCQDPGISPLVAEALRLGWKITSQVSKVIPLSPGLDRMPVNVGNRDFEVDKVSEFREYRKELTDKVIIVKNSHDNSTVKVIRQSDSSRYFPEGRRRIRARILKRMGGFYSCAGLMVTLTFDPKVISKEEAWHSVGRLGRSWLDNVNRWRVRNGMPRVRGIKVLEVQPGTGYPHLHYAFPKLRWLAKREVMRRYWKYAEEGVDWRYRDSFSPAGYVCKYVSKLEGWSDDALAEIWLNRTRLYSMSRDYYLVAEEKRVPMWQFVRSARIGSATVWFPSLVDEYDTVLGANDIAMEVYFEDG